MYIKILCVGKLKESFFRDAVSEYVKRLGRYVKTEIVEIPDEKAPENASDAEKLQIIGREGERLLEKIKDQDYVCALAIKGKKYSSEGFAGFIENLMNSGKSSIVFVIGGSLGLSGEILKRADADISFSDMTFPHQLMRVILAEQIFRAMKIIRGEPYHK